MCIGVTLLAAAMLLPVGVNSRSVANVQRGATSVDKTHRERQCKNIAAKHNEDRRQDRSDNKTQQKARVIQSIMQPCQIFCNQETLPNITFNTSKSTHKKAMETTLQTLDLNARIALENLTTLITEVR
jgi:hypothetical protein